MDYAESRPARILALASRQFSSDCTETALAVSREKKVNLDWRVIGEQDPEWD
jgi:hypothetical protein